MVPGPQAHPASFRDPDGFLFTRDGALHRQINEGGRADYELLMRSGLYARLAAEGLIVAHEEIGPGAAAAPGAAQVILPEPVPFVSYPYEWCFGQLKAAALLTLRLAREALGSGLTLKDASAYNVQFVGSRPLLIDTLSFTRYEEGAPWVAYKQFCQHFLAPLALMALRDVRLGRLSLLHIDGVPLDLAARLLPGRTRLRFALLAHIHLHARAQERYADAQEVRARRGVSRRGFLGLIDSLESAVRALCWRMPRTEWGDYYGATNYAPEAFEEKRRLVDGHLERVGARLAWDLGANTGVFSRLAAARGAYVVSGDVDPAAVEKNFLDAAARGEKGILPLVADLTNPSPGAGWANTERSPLLERGPADVVLALALVHHLAISNNLPLPRIAELFHRIGRHLVIEFVPKEDSQVRRLLATRKDVFPTYTREAFEEAFGSRFRIERRDPVGSSSRTLYLMSAAARP